MITWWGKGGDRKSPVELCPEEQSTDTGIHFETSPQTWYTRILDCRWIYMWPPRSSSEVSQEPVLPAAGPQTLRKVLQGLCKGTVAPTVIAGQTCNGLIPQRIQLVVVLGSIYKGKGSVTSQVTQDLS